MKALSMTIVCMLIAGCSQYRSIGVSPSSDPDHAPPLEARVVYVPGEDSPENQKMTQRGRILAWDEAGILFVPIDCHGEKCHEQIPRSRLRAIKVEGSGGLSGNHDACVGLGVTLGVLAVIGVVLFAVALASRDDQWSDFGPSGSWEIPGKGFQP
ncbi:MAG: hypothetical protein JRF33_17945 [Deltaproteobacteria bacterium]|nr:hypothetical protein [Deltaproteobacteria bacterium]